MSDKTTITPQSAAKVAARVDLSLAWLRFATRPEGSAERLLSDLLRRHGVGAVLRGLGIDRMTLGTWREASAVPGDRASSVVALHARLMLVAVPVATEQRLGIGKIDVEEASRLVEEGEKQEAIAARFGVTKQAVSKALKKHRRGGSDAA